ncbi:putative NSF attachment protein [Helianthus annuus]|nr:putative NSF attachment protein [Helianthus annuus]
MTASLCSHGVFVPIDVISQWMMVQGYSGHASYNGGLDVARKVLKQDGIRGLYRGFGLSEIAELYEQEQNLEQVIAYYDKTANLFQGEEVTTSANKCKQKIAQFSAQLEQYQKAIEIYDEIARQSLNNNLLKYGVRGHLLNVGICHLCKGDVAITNALERYQELDPTFSGTRECKLLADMAAAMDEKDVAKFSDAVKEFDSMTKLVIITLLWSYITQDKY